MHSTLLRIILIVMTCWTTMTFSLPAGPPTSGSSSPSQTKDQQGNLQLGTAIIGAGTGAAWYLGSQQQGNHPSLPLQDQPQQRQPRTQPLQPRPQPPQPRTNRGGGGGGGATGQNARSSSRARVIDKLGSADGYSQWESCMTYYVRVLSSPLHKFVFFQYQSPPKLTLI